jgi:sulfur carrier protein
MLAGDQADSGRSKHGAAGRAVTGFQAMRIRVNGVEREVPEATTVRDLVAGLGLPPGPMAVEVNRDVVPRARHPEHVLKEGDRVEVVTLVGGG